MNNSKTMLLNATDKQETRVAIVESEKLINFEIELGNKEQRKGNIYKAVITRVEPSLEACFLDYGTEKHGFLSFKDIDFSQFLDKTITEIANVVPGAEIIVQLEKEERGKSDIVYSAKVKAGKRRTYFFDVKRTKGEDFYLTLTESTKKFNGDGYERHKIFLYKEDFNRFLAELEETINHVKTVLMPDFDYDEYEKKQAEWEASIANENPDKTVDKGDDMDW